MKYNEKRFYQSKSEAFEVQNMSNGSTIELHYLNDEPFMTENINKARFSEWSSADGSNYKLFVEKGLYDVAGELFSKDVNEIWMQFWQKVDSMKKKYIFCFMLPMLLLFIAAFALIAIFLNNMTWLLIVALVVALFSSMLGSSMLSRNMQKENLLHASKIRDLIGVEKFEQIIKAQEKYIEDYYNALQAKYEEEDRLAEEQARIDEAEETESTPFAESEIEVEEDVENKEKDEIDE